jgi:hypothetical protein
MKICSYVEQHHEEWGTALFVLPAAIVGLLISGLAYGLSLLLG